MPKKNFTVFVSDGPEFNTNLMNLMENTFKKIGGTNKVSPYLFKMSNHDVRREFVSGGIISKEHSVLLDYTPSERSLNLTIISPNEIKYEEIIPLMRERFPECTTE